MAEYDYKCVPVPTTIFTGKAGKDPHISAVEQYQALIQSSAEGGWELYLTDSISSYQKPGCLGALFGNRGETVNYKLLIFRKPR